MDTGRIVDLQLRDGGWIHVRPIQPSDADGLVDLHARMSERTRYFRFFGAYPRMPSADRQRFVTVDHRNREALVAVLDNDLIAVARYERLASATDAEVAFVVADAHQRRGIAPALLGRLVLAAREAGIARFIAEVLPGNAPMMRVFARAGFEIEHEYADGVIHVAFSIHEKQQASDLPEKVTRLSPFAGDQSSSSRTPRAGKPGPGYGA